MLDRLRPAAFVMENVKGMLSSTVESRLVFEMLMEDLYIPRQKPRPSVRTSGHSGRRWQGQPAEAMRPSDFIVRAEEFGVPQRRHRVIIVGIRSDLAGKRGGRQHSRLGDHREQSVTLLEHHAVLRSGISRGADSAADWRQEVVDAARLLARIHPEKG